MTTYDKASLVMIPSGYKDDKLYSVKPTDGSGDFTFSRDGSGASPATRVNASGLIEKGRENGVTYSNDFGNAAWTKSGVTLTGGQAGYDGSNDAWLLSGSNTSFCNIQNNNGIGSGVITFSVYAKAGNTNYIALQPYGSGASYVKFDLSTGSVFAVPTTPISYGIESVGGGWYRCYVVDSFVASFCTLYLLDSSGNFSNTSSDSIYIQDAQTEKGLVATAPAIETTTAAVSAGLLGDMPRLDYSGGATCPNLLLEPSRVNNLGHSEYISAGVTWITSGGMLTTQNDAISPEGVQNAVKMTRPSNTGASWLTNFISGNVGQNQVLSIFVKAGTASVFNITYYDAVAGDIFINFNLSTQEVIHYGSPYYVDGDIEDYGNGWYRCYVVIETASTSSRQFQIAIGTNRYGAADEYLYIYGASWEDNASYPTSYIPTYGSASTRGADNGSKALPDSILGADYNEGTLFFELELNQEAITRAVSIESGYWTTSSVRIECTPSTGLFACDIVNASVGATGTSITLSPLSKGDTIKCALAWNNGTFVFYANGQSTSGSCPVMTTKIYNLYLNRLGTFTGVGNYASNDFKQVLVFPTALTNAELAALTTL